MDEIQNINECEIQASNHSKKATQNSTSDLSNGKLFDSDDSKVLGFTPISSFKNKYKRLNSSNYRYYRIFNKSSTVSLSELSCSEAVPVNDVLASTPFHQNISSFRLDLNYTTDREDTSKIDHDDRIVRPGLRPQPNLGLHLFLLEKEPRRNSGKART